MILGTLVALLPLALLVVAGRPFLDGWRWALLVAAVGWGVTLVAFTEGLSAVRALSISGMLVLWGGLSLALAWAVWRNRVALRQTRLPRIPPGWVERLLLLGVTGLVGVLGVLALVAPPNTYDAMTYHMSRVAHWIHNGSVSHYPTSIIRQLFQPPGAEFVILHLQVLTGGDRFANLVQWSSLVASLVGVSLLAKQLGGNGRAAVLTVVVAATIPMGVMQASSTQNDYVVSFWLVCLAVFVLRLNRQPGGSGQAWWALFVGAALGLALLTKATAYIFAFPLMVWMLLVRIRRDGLRAWRVLVLVVAVATAINAPHVARNLMEYGAPLGPASEADRYLNATLSSSSLVSVAVRNVALHLGARWSAINALTGALVHAVHRFLGLEVDDPASTLQGMRFRMARSAYQEDVAANGWHLGLVVLAGVAVVIAPPLRRRAALVTYTGLLVTGFGLFSLILRWQPWHSRLHLPLFVLAAPVVGIVLARGRWLGPLVALGLMVATIPWLLFSETKPLLGRASLLHQDRETLYFAMRPDLREPYRDTVTRLRERGCEAVGLLMDENGFEYPLWVLMGSWGGGGRPQLRHVGMRDERGAVLGAEGDLSLQPCAVIATHPAVSDDVAVNGLAYRRVTGTPFLFLPREGLDVSGDHGGPQPVSQEAR